MNAKILVFVICIEAIVYLLLYNLLDSTFNKITKHFLIFEQRRATESKSNK